jgi:hypothetical protein
MRVLMPTTICPAPNCRPQMQSSPQPTVTTSEQEPRRCRCDFYVMLALRAQLRASGWFTQKNIPEPNLARLLDLVALGTVADVVPLDHNNRILVAQGLKRINASLPLPAGEGRGEGERNSTHFQT